jgi:hypothetical protein
VTIRSTAAGVRATIGGVRVRLRHLHFQERTFTWRATIGHVRMSGNCHRCVRVRVWGDRHGRALQADLLSTAAPGPYGACATDWSYPTSGDVRLLVEGALRQGWDPAVRGGTHRMSERDGRGLGLSGFVVTDRVVAPEG